MAEVLPARAASVRPVDAIFLPPEWQARRKSGRMFGARTRRKGRARRRRKGWARRPTLGVRMRGARPGTPAARAPPPRAARAGTTARPAAAAVAGRTGAPRAPSNARGPPQPDIRRREVLLAALTAI